jgi:hypothetical protein
MVSLAAWPHHISDFIIQFYIYIIYIPVKGCRPCHRPRKKWEAAQKPVRGRRIYIYTHTYPQAAQFAVGVIDNVAVGLEWGHGGIK